VTDSDPKIVELQRELLRKAGPARRAALALSLSSTVIQLSRRELRARFPAASDEDLAVEWVARSYGTDLAERLRQFLVVRGGLNRNKIIE
jgi:hypothetical protein